MKTFIQSIRNGARPNLEECIEALGERFGLLNDFANTRQDPQWHAEGDVHIHTNMVLDEARKLLAGPACYLSDSKKLLVYLGALFHDIAKPLSTREQEIKGVMRIAARGHEAAGRSYLAPKLFGLGLTNYEIETLLGLVGYHHEPKFTVIREMAAGKYKRLARLADPELLYWVEVADMSGRECDDKQKQLEVMEYYKMFSQEYGAFVRGGAHTSLWKQTLSDAISASSPDTLDFVLAKSQLDLESGAIQSVEEAVARSYKLTSAPYPELIVLVGPSGSGKSTFANKHLKNDYIISLDELREELGGGRAKQDMNRKVLQEARERLKDVMRKKRRAVWDATSLRKDFRGKIANIVNDYGGMVTFIVFHSDLESYHKRNRSREYAIPTAALSSQIERMQWPDLDEAHRVLYLNEASEVRASFGFSKLPFGLKHAGTGDA